METSNRTQRNICGAAIKRLRLGHGYTQEQLAVKCQIARWDVDRKLISKIEIGIRELSDANLRILAQVLSVEISEFFTMSKAELHAAVRVSTREAGKVE